MTNYGRVSGINSSPYRTDSLTYRAQLPNHSPLIEIASRPSSLILTLTLSAGKPSELFSKSGIPVIALNFTRQTPRGDFETTLVKAGVISYPDHPKVEQVTFKPPDFVASIGWRDFALRK
jgi:hypothetical protein